nr:NAD-dependent epimerase/dehydratase family protein [Planctomonas sp. JC2975]
MITGGAGFIGSRLAQRFARAGHRVTVLDSLSPQVHGDDPANTSPLLASVLPVASVIQGSVTDIDALAAALDGHEIVIHLAAETGTGQSMYEIDRYVDVNVGGTAKLLDIITNRSTSVRRLVVASSRSIYGEGEYRDDDGATLYPAQRSDVHLAAGNFDVLDPATGEPLIMVPTRETARLHPSSVYGITKQMQESLVMTVGAAIGLESVALRYQNVYGPGQSLSNPYTGILSIFSSLIAQDKEINIFEDGLESRDFVYIDDVVDATYLAATRSEAIGQVFNVGSGVATTVEQVVEALFAAYGRHVPTRVSGNYRLGDIRHNVADTSLIHDLLGFTPSISFEDGVKRFADWVATQPIAESGYERSLTEMSERKLLK